jgi:2-polyprenyl-6-methoxyphenol hydroxylase and related FAD-dependent oxidoreductases
VTSLHDLTLLDVFAGCAQQWARDGLVLIGDSAHTHGPLGAQGINLALQDAALLHPILVKALRTGDVSAAALGEFATLRRPDVDRVLKMQLMQSKGMLAKNPVADAIRPVATTLIGRTPIGKKITQRIAFGNPAIRVHSELFVTD